MITGQLKQDLVAQLSTRSHQFLSGLSEKLGGHDEGPDPHELLEAALAACTILTVQLYANRKAMKLESTDVTIKILAEGAETRISSQVSFRGELSDDDRKRLLEIVGKCPIHRLLESHVTIETTAV